MTAEKTIQTINAILNAYAEEPARAPVEEHPAEAAEAGTEPEEAPAYTITRNEKYNSLEISFQSKPAAEVREALKACGFRWNGKAGIWYGYTTEEDARAAIEGKEAPEAAEKPQKATEKANGPSKEEIRAEYSKAWNSQKMVDFCTNKVAAVAVLPSGEWITVDKHAIETRFCFGESGYDADEARDMAHVARTSEDYFKRENMAHFREWLKDLDEVKDIVHGGSRYALTIHGTRYTGQKDDCRLARIELTKLTEVLDDLGGSAYTQELPGQTITGRHNGHIYRVATPEEIDIIRAAYEEAAKAHEKKVDAYLKRYGTSKVHSWTYWRDA